MNQELKQAIKEVLEAFETPDSHEALVGAMYQLKRIYNQYDQQTNNSLRTNPRFQRN